MNIACPHCRGLVADTPELRGRVIACPHCGGHFAMPDLSAAPPAATQERPLPSPPQASPAELPIPGPAASQERPLAPPSAGREETPLASPSAPPSRTAASPTQGGASPSQPAASPPQPSNPAPQIAPAPAPAHRPSPAPPSSPASPAVGGPAAGSPANPAPATPTRPAPLRAAPAPPTPLQAAPVRATPVAAAPLQAAPPAPASTASASGKPGSTLIQQRRARQRGSALKTVLLLLFGLMATVFTVVLIAFLWGYSTLQEHRQQSQGKYDTARKTARQQLKSMDGMVLEPEPEITFYEDGCIVRGFARTKTQTRVPVEVSIGIYENEIRSTWLVETVVVDEKTVYSRDYN